VEVSHGIFRDPSRSAASAPFPAVLIPLALDVDNAERRIQQRNSGAVARPDSAPLSDAFLVSSSMAPQRYPAPDYDTLFGPGRFLPSLPVCPSGGAYTVDSVSMLPVCSLGVLGHTVH
jgi:hypothetical protein